MDNKTARQKLSELRDSLDKVLGNKDVGPSREDAEKALKSAREGVKRTKKTLLGKIKDLPVVDKITQLGAAGTVAVSTAAVTQTNIAVDETEVFVASVANDVVHERLRFPPIINNFVDFSALDSWGRKTMQAKVAEVKAEVAKVEAKVTEVQSNPSEKAESQEPQAQEKSASNAEENQESAKSTEQNIEEVKGEETKAEEVKESNQENLAEDVPEENTEETIDEIDEIKPHSDFNADEATITPNDALVVSPSGQRQV